MRCVAAAQFVEMNYKSCETTNSLKEPFEGSLKFKLVLCGEMNSEMKIPLHVARGRNGNRLLIGYA